MHLRALKIDWCLSTLVLERLPSADRKTPGYITPKIDIAELVPSILELVYHSSQLKSLLQRTPNFRPCFPMQPQKSQNLNYLIT